jgi:tRNA A-37 threonylcarbamoyl transferase component Bud32
MASARPPDEGVRPGSRGEATLAPAPADVANQATIPPAAHSAADAATIPPGGPRPLPPDAGAGSANAFLNVPGYEILSVLGQGGMGVVYKALHSALHRTVALKMIRGSFVERGEQRQRFLLEAEAVARLQHANIVQIYEIGDVTLADGSSAPFMALEFVEGPNLESHLQGKPLSPPAAADLVAGLARAMAFAHERNLIHRDLKPANVLLAKWEAADFNLVRELKGHEKIVTTVRYSPAGNTIYSTSFDGTSRIWNAATGECLHILKQESRVVHGDLSPDGNLYITGGEDNLVHLWDAKTGQPAYPPLRGHTNTVMHSAFSPDSRLLATTSLDYSTRLWDAATGATHGPPLLHDGTMIHVAFSRDGRRLATASEDNTARLWDVETGRPVTPPLVHPAWAMDAEFSRDRSRVITAMRRSAARFWNAETGQPMSPFIMHPSGRVLEAVYTADETHFIATGSDGGLFIWPVPTDSRPTEDLIRLAEAYFGYRLDEFGGFSAMPLAEHQVLWKDMAARYPADFSVSTQARLAWHRREMAAAVKERKPMAVVFHFLRGYPEWSMVLEVPRLIAQRGR